MSKSSLVAAADTVQDVKSAGEKSETVPVTGIRASLKESPDVKRDSQTVVDVISSEDVGKFPDKNIAEALQRVSGVSISREYGEGERVSISGNGPNLHRAPSSMATAWQRPSGSFCDHLAEGIFDPAKIARLALQNAASVAGLLLTTEVMIANAPKEEAHVQGAPGGMGGMQGAGMLGTGRRSASLGS